jgi:hypothetical protein
MDQSIMDFVRELRLRQWARQNFVPAESRKMSWHPVVLDEMMRRDLELLNELQATTHECEPVAIENSPVQPLVVA